MKKLKIGVLMHPALIPPDSREGVPEKVADTWKTEFDVVSTLRDLRHQVRPVGVYDDLMPVRDLIAEWEPDLIFNLLEEFLGSAEFDFHVVTYLEMKQVPFTGCRPRGLIIARDKALAKKILHYHRIRVPHFAVFPRRRRVVRPRELKFPLIVKSLTEEASVGIAQASVVWNDEELEERVRFIHESITGDALVEEYIDGREIYAGILGNERPEALPLIELDLSQLPEGTPRIAGYDVKFDRDSEAYKKTKSAPAENLEEATDERLKQTALSAYQVLGLRDYARIDMRLTSEGKIYVIEANPNPWLSSGAEFSMAARKSGRTYAQMIGEIVDAAYGRYA